MAMEKSDWDRLDARLNRMEDGLREDIEGFGTRLNLMGERLIETRSKLTSHIESHPSLGSIIAALAGCVVIAGTLMGGIVWLIGNYKPPSVVDVRGFPLNK